MGRDRKEYAAIKDLISRAFPKNEQISMWLLRLLALRKNVQFLAFYDNRALCGISYTISSKTMVFVLYLAVNDTIRSKGYGSAIIRCLNELYGNKPLSLNVESLDPNADNAVQRVKRVEFYRKNGFEITDYLITDKSGEYLILSTADNFSVSEYRCVIEKFALGFYSPKIKRRDHK